MQYEQYVRDLVCEDELQKWGSIISHMKGQERLEVFQRATSLWIERMTHEGKLLLHPDIIAELRKNNWQPEELQKKMIWASIVCKLDGEEQKSEKAKVRQLLQRKYGNDWWEDVYARAGKVWPAWARMKRRILSDGPVTSFLAANTSIIGQAMQEEFMAILRMVPKS